MSKSECQMEFSGMERFINSKLQTMQGSTIEGAGTSIEGK